MRDKPDREKKDVVCSHCGQEFNICHCCSNYERPDRDVACKFCGKELNICTCSGH